MKLEKVIVAKNNSDNKFIINSDTSESIYCIDEIHNGYTIFNCLFENTEKLEIPFEVSMIECNTPSNLDIDNDFDHYITHVVNEMESTSIKDFVGIDENGEVVTINNYDFIANTVFESELGSSNFLKFKSSYIVDYVLILSRSNEIISDSSCDVLTLVNYATREMFTITNIDNLFYIIPKNSVVVAVKTMIDPMTKNHNDSVNESIEFIMSMV